ncbi:MAG TPA: DNA-3-methyladenine glycosylase I [Acidimicrobiales bacterium]|nr:DNA-3-methyladenine glycosylase I [Acidimicrobiales bacterium]
MTGRAVVGDDGNKRCPWGVSTPEYRFYHDTEWGRPEGEEDRIYEKLCLEGFQSGLSWLTILRKREGFRNAFAHFNPEVVANFGEADVQRLLLDRSIVRHRAKIEAAIGNARAVLDLRAQGSSLAGLVWASEVPARRGPTSTADVPASTPQSIELSAQLRRRGFRFVGPTTVYASMQSLGVVNDHLRDCHFRAAAEAERSVFTVPAYTAPA